MQFLRGYSSGENDYVNRGIRVVVGVRKMYIDGMNLIRVMDSVGTTLAPGWSVKPPYG